MRQLTPHQPPPDIRITPQEWEPDPEMSLKHDDLHARAWGCEREKPNFDAEINNATPPMSTEISVQFNLSTEETRNAPETAHECFPEALPQMEQVCDVTNTYPYMESDGDKLVETSSEQANKRPTNHRSSKNNLRHNPKPKCSDDYRY